MNHYPDEDEDDLDNEPISPPGDDDGPPDEPLPEPDLYRGNALRWNPLTGRAEPYTFTTYKSDYLYDPLKEPKE